MPPIVSATTTPKTLPIQDSMWQKRNKDVFKMIGEEVVVTSSGGDQAGVLMAVQPNYCHCVLMTDPDKIIITSVRRITRKRNPAR